MKFQAGKSGNPGGRPKQALEVRDLARKHTKQAIETLVAALSDDRLRVSAAAVILDRGWGKPAQAHTGEGGEGPVRVEVVTGIADHQG